MFVKRGWVLHARCIAVEFVKGWGCAKKIACDARKGVCPLHLQRDIFESGLAILPPVLAESGKNPEQDGKAMWPGGEQEM